jgi:hypothetical protein
MGICYAVTLLAISTVVFLMFCLTIIGGIEARVISVCMLYTLGLFTENILDFLYKIFFK